MKGQNLRFRNYKFHLECGIDHHSARIAPARVLSGARPTRVPESEKGTVRIYRIIALQLSND